MKKIYLSTYLFRRYEILAAAAIVLSVVTFLTSVALIPNIKTAIQIKREQEILTEKLTVFGKKEAILFAQYSSLLATDLSSLTRILPSSKDYVSLFSTLDSIEAKTGVRIIHTNFQLGSISSSQKAVQKSTVRGALVIPVQIEIEGDYASTLAFFESMTDYSGRFMSADSIEWRFFPDRTIRSQILGKAYFYPIPEIIGNLDSPLPMLTSEHEEILKKIIEKQN